MTGTVRLSILWTEEILLSPDDAEKVARSLQQAAAQGPHNRYEHAAREHSAPT
ncbi:hypothetical protein [Streptomyces lunaelactis]|uniref:hypothetical protein n=1 Tax=Streptomyces lunaelactis TaxID=1535768 RepID=UPI001584615D|nr:hypothetical protein [Streptomyces lunaelactis]NUK60108.1 hypothetical protein [Streptomyces lunaelactis]